MWKDQCPGFVGDVVIDANLSRATELATGCARSYTGIAQKFIEASGSLEPKLSALMFYVVVGLHAQILGLCG